jgi:hypothetical protein
MSVISLSRSTAADAGSVPAPPVVGSDLQLDIIAAHTQNIAESRPLPRIDFIPATLCTNKAPKNRAPDAWRRWRWVASILRTSENIIASE